MAHAGRHGADDMLVVAIAAGLTQQQAARQAGVSPRTVTRRMADPDFRQAVQDARSATVEQTAARLTSAGLSAVNALLRLLNAESESVQLGAAKAILELGGQLRKLEDIEARLASLEAERTPGRKTTWN